MINYILDGEAIVPCPDMREWGKWMKTDKRFLWRTETAYALVSTVFLGNDRRFIGDGPPVVFETMIFGGGEFNQEQERYTTYADAQAGHERWAAVVRDHETAAQP